MSELALAHAEKRVQTFILKPLSFMFIVATLVTAYFHLWWAVGIYVLLWFYVGRVGVGLFIHQGKSFDELSKGVTPELPPSNNDDLDSYETRKLATTMVHVFYVIAITGVVTLISYGVKIYWAFLVGVGIWFLTSVLAGMSAALLSTKRKPAV